MASDSGGEAMHTPEPWSVAFGPDLGGGWQIEPSFVRAGTGLVVCERSFSVNPAEAKANAERIVQCVNALAGVPDPARALEAARKALEVCDDWIGRQTMTSGAAACLSEIRASLALLGPGEEKS